MKSLRDAGEPSIRFTLPVMKIIDGRDNLRSVNETALSFILRDVRDEISALRVKSSSPETCAESLACRLSHAITLRVFENDPQPVRMLNVSSRFVLPLPLGPRIKLIPGSHLILRTGLLFIVRFLKSETRV